MRPFSVLGAIVIVAVVCIACAALSSARDRPVIPAEGRTRMRTRGTEMRG